MQNATMPTLPATPNVGQILLYYLALEGVEYVFGIPGGGLGNLLVNFKDERDRFTYIICRQETGAGYMADGYYRATGKLGVVMVTSGPGATNALTGVMNAQSDGSAVLLITGEVDQQFYGKGYLQEGIDARLDINAVYAAAVRMTTVITAASDCQTLFRQALRDVLSLPRNAAHISMPNNVTVETLDSPSVPSSVTAYRAIPQGVPLDTVRTAVQALLACKRPLLLIGNGCREALRDPAIMKALLKFAETYGIPVVTTADGKGVFPESHPLSLRVYGIADCMWPYYWLNPKEAGADPYDGVMVIASQLGELSTNMWSPMLIPKNNGPFIQVDLNQAMIGRAFDVTQGIVGEAGAFIRDLAQLIPEFPPDQEEVTARKKIVAGIKKQYSPFFSPEQYYSDASPMEPAAMMRVLQETLPKDSIIYIDAGNCVGWGVHYLAIDPPGMIHSSLSMGPMGFAVGAVAGGKIGCPDRTCIALTGDGAFMMHGAEVSTARHNNVGAIWLVFYDNELNMVSQGQMHFFPDAKDPGVWDTLYALGAPDLEQYARGLGADAHSVHDPAQLAAIMPKVLENANSKGRPQVIVAHINTQSIPPYYDPIYAG